MDGDDGKAAVFGDLPCRRTHQRSNGFKHLLFSVGPLDRARRRSRRGGFKVDKKDRAKTTLPVALNAASSWRIWGSTSRRPR
jgi:hypothetical protein